MFSFKINKKASSTSAPHAQKGPSLQTASSKKAFHDDVDKEEDERDFIEGLDGREILSKKQKKPEKKQLVIPLITKNEWRIDKKKEKEVPDKEHRHSKKEESDKSNDKNNELLISSSDKEPNKAETAESLKEQAIKELLEEAGNPVDHKSTRSIPLLLQNKVPDGYEEEENMDVSLRPDQSSLDDYERIPIEEFGMAMLRGMGWKEDEGIGLRNKKVVDMAEPKLRPKGMGLGAEPSHLNKDATPKTASKANEKEDLTLKIGASVIVTRGSKRGYYGQVESFDEDNNRVILRLAISGKMEAVSKFYIDVVAADEYKKYSKVINKGKYEEYKNKQENNNGSNTSSHAEKRKEHDRRSRSRSNTRSSSEEEKSSSSRSKPRRNERERGQYDSYDDDDDYYRKDKDRKRAGSGHRSNNDERKSSISNRKEDKYSTKYDYDSSEDERERKRSYKSNNDHYKSSSSRNGDKRNDSYYSSSSRRSRKDDHHRDRDHKRSHSSRNHRD